MYDEDTKAKIVYFYSISETIVVRNRNLFFSFRAAIVNNLHANESYGTTVVIPAEKSD